MPELKKVFTSGRMNKDLDVRLIPNGEYRDAQNIEIATSDGSDVGSVQNISGTTIRNARIWDSTTSSSLATWADKFGLDTLECVGSTVDTKENKIYWFLHGKDASGVVYNLIMEYDEAGNIISPVLIDKADDDGNTILDFNIDNERGDITNITGINIIEGWLFWTDNKTEPKQLDIAKWKNLNINTSTTHTKITEYTAPTKYPNKQGALSNFKEEHITVIKKSPLTAPTVTTSTARRDPVNLVGLGSVTNSAGLGNNPVYTNYNFNPSSGTIASQTTVDGFKFNTSPNWVVGDTVEFKHEHVVNGVVEQIFEFQGKVSTLTGNEASIFFFNIPGDINNLGDNTVRWEVTRVEGDPMFELQFVRFAYRWKYANGQYSCYSPFTQVVFIPSEFKYLSSDGHNIGMTNNIRYVKLSNFDTKPDDVIEIDILYKESNNNLVHIVDTLKTNHTGFKTDTEVFELEESEVYGAIIPEIQLLRPWDNVPRKALAQEVTGNRLVYGNYTQNYDIINMETPSLKVANLSKYPVYLNDSGVETEFDPRKSAHDWVEYPPVPKPSLKSIRTYQVGIVYQDVYGRQTPVLTAPEASIHIPKHPQAALRNQLTVTAKNDPPSWATHFKYFVKEVSSEYYNLAMDRYYMAEDNNIWLSFPSSERNKVDEESFLILKKQHGSNQLVRDNSKYKVLQIEEEAPEFIAQARTFHAEADVAFRDSNVERPNTGNRIFSFVGPSNSEHSNFAESFVGGAFIQIKDKSFATPSKKYEIDEGGLTGEIEDESSSTIPNNSVYRVTLKKPIEDTDSFIDSMTSENFRIVMYKKADRFLPEFEGRFFVKIQRNAGIDENLLVSNFTDTYTPIASQVVGANIYNTDRDPGETYQEQAWALPNNGKTGANSGWIRPRHPDTDDDGFGKVFAGWKDKYCKRYSGYISSTGSYVEGTDFAINQGSEGEGKYWWHPRVDAGPIGGSSRGPGEVSMMRIMAAPYNGANRSPHASTAPNKSWLAADDSIIEDKPHTAFFDSLQPDVLIQFEGQTSASDTSLTKGEVYRVTKVKKHYRRRGYAQKAQNAVRVEYEVLFHLNGDNTQGYKDHFTHNTATHITKVYIVTRYDEDDDGKGISSSNPAIWETETREVVDLDIYREASDAYPIDEHSDDKTLSYMNCFSFGNGVESNRIRDDFNQVIIDKGPKASTIIGEQYEEEERKSGLIFSGIFNTVNGINRLNQFIMAEKITKDLNPEYGSIQKLHSRNTDLITLCEDKVIRILANKDALYNADGKPQLTASNNVLGQAVPYVGEYGISKNPESFCSHAYRVYFTDKARGAVLRLSRDGLTNIAQKGMTSWFRDNLATSTLFVGSYDERKGFYNISLSNKTVSFDEKVNGWTSFKTFIPERGVSLNDKYYTMKNGNLYSHDSDTRNTFYGTGTNYFNNSTISLVFNDAPNVVKGFQTLNYDGTQARTYTYVTGTIGLDSTTGDYDTSGHSQTEKNKGWYSSAITTDLQTGGVTEFIDKEGRWYNYIKGDKTTLSNLDSKEFSVQGIGKYSAMSGDVTRSKRNVSIKLDDQGSWTGGTGPFKRLIYTEYGPTEVTIGDGVHSTIGAIVLKISPADPRATTVIAGDFSSPSAHWHQSISESSGVIQSVAFTQNGDDVDVTITFNSSYNMPDSDKVIEIPIGSAMQYGAKRRDVSINGTFDVEKSNAVQTQAIGSNGGQNITGSVTATTYTASSEPRVLDDLNIHTVTFTADTGTKGNAFLNFSNIDYTFDTGTTDADPGTKEIRFNNANAANVTEIYIDDVSVDPDDATSTTDQQYEYKRVKNAASSVKGYIRVADNGSTTNYTEYKITSATEASGYWKFVVSSPTAGSGGHVGIAANTKDVTLYKAKDYHFNTAPLAEVVTEDKNPLTEYTISTAHTTDSDQRITATTFTIKYRFGSDISRYGDKIKFVANAIEKIYEDVEILNMTVDNDGYIPASSSFGKPIRTIYISGHPTAVFTLTHNNGSTTTTLKTDQAIGTSGTYGVEVEFPHVTANTTHTFTLTSSQGQLAVPFPDANPLILYQYIASTITWKFQSSTLGLTTSGGSTNTVDVVNTGMPNLVPASTNKDGNISISWIVDTPASIPLKTYGTPPTGDAPLFTNIDSAGYEIEFTDVVETFSSKGGGAPTGTRLTLTATGDILKFGAGAINSVLDIEPFIKYNEPPVCNAVNVSCNKGAAVTVQLSATDPESDTLTLSTVGSPSVGSLGSINQSNDQVVYTHNNSSTLVDSFTYKANDTYQDSNTATVNVAVGVGAGDSIVTESVGDGIYLIPVVVGTGAGTFKAHFNAASRPDRFSLWWDDGDASNNLSDMEKKADSLWVGDSTTSSIWPAEASYGSQNEYTYVGTNGNAVASGEPGGPLHVGTGALTSSITTNSSDATNGTYNGTVGSTSGYTTTNGVSNDTVIQVVVSGNAVTQVSVTTAGAGVPGFNTGETITVSNSVIGGSANLVITLVAADINSAWDKTATGQTITIESGARLYGTSGNRSNASPTTGNQTGVQNGVYTSVSNASSETLTSGLEYKDGNICLFFTKSASTSFRGYIKVESVTAGTGATGWYLYHTEFVTASP